MPSLTMVKPWDMQHVADVLCKLYAEQTGVAFEMVLEPKEQTEKTKEE